MPLWRGILYHFFYLYFVLHTQIIRGNWRNPRKWVQLQTTKANQLIISGTRIFGENLMTDLKPDRQKQLKNGVFTLFPRFLAVPKF